MTRNPSIERRTKGCFAPFGPPLMSNVRCHKHPQCHMHKRFKVIPSGTFTSKQIAVADTDRVDEYQRVASEFMSEIFDLLPDDYAISDESELRDFVSFGNADTSQEWKLIEERYGVVKADVGTESLADIFSFISNVRGHGRDIGSAK